MQTFVPSTPDVNTRVSFSLRSWVITGGSDFVPQWGLGLLEFLGRGVPEVVIFIVPFAWGVVNLYFKERRELGG